MDMNACAVRLRFDGFKANTNFVNRVGSDGRCFKKKRQVNCDVNKTILKTQGSGGLQGITVSIRTLK